MARPPCCRRIEGEPLASVFKPAGVPTEDLEQVPLTLDEFEALRLADIEGMAQMDASVCMAVSRPTFGRILRKAHAKVARALWEGRALVIQGGPIFARGEKCGHRRCEEGRTVSDSAEAGRGAEAA